MNKRNTEGFVLAYVMIVIAVVSAITMALTTSTLNVLKAQEQSVERMQDKYDAMGRIELTVAHAEANASAVLDISVNGSCPNEITEDEIEDLYVKSNCMAFVNNAMDLMGNTFNDPDGPVYYSYTHIDEDTLEFFLSSNSDTVEVNAIVKLFYDSIINVTPPANPEDDPEGTGSMWTYEYTITDFTLEFVSYEITSIGGAA